MDSYLVIIPALLVLILSISTHRVLPSLLVGIVSAGLIATKGNLIQTFWLALTRMFAETGISDLYHMTGSYQRVALFGFLAFLGILIEIITHTGAIKVYTNLFMRYIKSAKQAQMACLVLAWFFFLDDYLDSLIVGSVMRPITDKFGIPRIKLAYLINAMAAPLAILIPASSWTGIITTQFTITGIDPQAAQPLIAIDSFFLLLLVLPFIVYALLSILNAWFVVLANISFGIMHKHETIARETGNLFGNGKTIESKYDTMSDHDASISDMLIPMLSFVLVTIGLLLYTGDSALIGGKNNFLWTLINANSLYALFCGSLTAVLISGARFLYKKQGTWRDLMSLVFEGISLLKLPLLLLLAAWTFAAIMEKDLNMGAYVADSLLTVVNLHFVPLIFFISATLTTAATGSSWGTITLLIPLTLPVLVHLIGTPPLDASAVYTIAPVMASLLSGTIAGSHLSPITDAMIISSTSSRCDHATHTRSMVSYSIAPLIGSIVGILIIGFVPHWGYSKLLLLVLSTSILITFAITLLFNYLFKLRSGRTSS